MVKKQDKFDMKKALAGATVTTYIIKPDKPKKKVK